MIVRSCFEMFYHDQNLTINLTFEIIWCFFGLPLFYCVYGLKGACVNANFIFVIKIWKSQEKKKNINCSCPKYHKMINWSKNSHKFLFSHFLWCLFEARKRSVKVIKICRFSALFEIGKARFKTVFVELLSYTVSISLATEIHKNKTWNIKIKLFC